MTGPTGGTNRVLLDTNVLVYCYDRSEPRKQESARALLKELARLQTGAVTTQVLGEFFAVLTRKLAHSVSVESALEQLQHHLRLWTVFDLTGQLVLEATASVRAYRLNYWDAQIWAAAHLHRIPVVLSEDFSHGAVLGGVRFVNPFLRDFRLHDWT